MLPEFLFAAGSSMQDISRDELNLLNSTGYEKDTMCSSVIQSTASPFSPKAHKSTSMDGSSIGACLDLPIGVTTKLENIQNEILPSPTSWHHHHQQMAQTHHNPKYHQQTEHETNHHGLRLENMSSRLLLRGSDDPLICRGANTAGEDDHTVELNSSSFIGTSGNVDTNNSSISERKAQTTAPMKSAGKQNLIKRKGAVKLRFHHQALPPEYLNHYEATQNRLKSKSREKATTISTKRPPQQTSTTNANENIRSWLQKIADTQKTPHQDCAKDDNKDEMYRVASPDQSRLTYKTIDLALAQSSQQFNGNTNFKSPSAKATKSGTKRLVSYSDLPYMGEITLENSKPRRGRKPKKADICHLIYKNYGTIFPGTPSNILKNNIKPTIETNFNLNCDSPESLAEILNNSKLCTADEPLNLCLRDQSIDRYSLSSGNDDECNSSITNSNCSTPVMAATLSDSVTDSLLAATLKSSMPSLQQHQEKNCNKPETSLLFDGIPDETANNVGNEMASNLLLHPMSLYYQKLIESRTLSADDLRALGFSTETINQNNQLSLKITIPNGFFINCPATRNGECKTLKLRENPEMIATSKAIKSEKIPTSAATTTNGNSYPVVTGINSQIPQTTNSLPSPSSSSSTSQKRKRSAIFIPPMPVENTTNPATEVSICKFKFTGGAKPSLQEKKMLSVDSDGNYSYYSGTGDKSMRGYEFFPRECLQQSGVVPGVNCSGAFLNATGERITGDIPTYPLAVGLSNNCPKFSTTNTTSPQQKSQSSPAKTIIDRFTEFKANNVIESTTPLSSSPSSLLPLERERKKKSRRSVQREKLEKTFKEKGFLIQTQKLESAEGATYCKFRQLKKFTRYLFRNWKDYLPEELQQANAAAAAAAVAARVTGSTLNRNKDQMNVISSSGFESIPSTTTLLPLSQKSKTSSPSLSVSPFTCKIEKV